MVHYYYFFRDLSNASAGSVIYSVKVGECEKDQVKLALVQEFCKDCGYYFKPVSTTSDAAVKQLEKKLFPVSSLYSSPMKRTTVTIQALYQLIMDDTFVFFERSLAAPRGNFLFSVFQRTKNLPTSKIKKFHTSCPSKQRKHLKYRNAEGMNSFLIGSAIVLIIFLIAGKLEGMFVYNL